MKIYPYNKVLGSIGNFIKKIDMNPDYQRKEIWSKEQRLKLIDSVFRNFDIPKIYIRKKEQPDGEVEYEIIDGKQRLTTFEYFIKNKLKLKNITEFNNKTLDGKLYEHLTGDEKEHFDSYQLAIIEVEGTDEEIREMFKRLQEGTSTRPQEKRNASLSKINEDVKEIVQHGFFDAVGFTNKRLNYNEMAAHFLHLELTGGEHDISQNVIDNLYENYYETGLPETKEKVLQVLDFLQNNFPDKNKFNDKNMLKKTTCHSLYLVASQFIDEYGEIDANNYIPDFQIWFENFLERKEQNKNEGYNDPIFNDYIYYISKSTTSSESLLRRKEILINDWYNYLQYSQNNQNKEAS